MPRDIAVAQASKHCGVAHWIELPDGRVLVSSEFTDEMKKDDLERNVSVEPCCHDNETVSDAHLKALEHLGVQKQHTSKDVRKLAKRQHPLM
jgi:hypothetical protein